MCAVVELFIDEGSVILSVTDPLVLAQMLGVVVPDTGLIVRISNETLIDGEGVVVSPELFDIGGDISG